MSGLYWALLVSPSASGRLSQMFVKTPFAGIHQLAWFDWAMLIPYFTVLVILSVYGIHRLRYHPHLFQVPQECHRRAAPAL